MMMDTANVQLTFLSISVSHMSLIVQPAPLMMNAPKPKSISILRSGKHPGTALRAMLQPHGQKSSQEPAAYKYRVNCMTTHTGDQTK